MSSRRAGFTLVEALIALFIAAAVGVIASASLRGERGQAAALADTLARHSAADLAAELLAEELSLAASSPLSALNWTPDGHVPSPWDSEAHLIVTLAGAALGEDLLSVRYFDERVAGAPLLRDLTFESAVDSSGTHQLYRRPDGASRQPLVEGVTGLSVIGVVASGSPARFVTAAALSSLAPDSVSAVAIEIHAGETVRPLLIELPNRPTLAVLGGR